MFVHAFRAGICMTGYWERIFKQAMCKKIRNLRKPSGNAVKNFRKESPLPPLPPS